MVAVAFVTMTVSVSEVGDIAVAAAVLVSLAAVRAGNKEVPNSIFMPRQLYHGCGRHLCILQNFDVLYCLLDADCSVEQHVKNVVYVQDVYSLNAGFWRRHSGPMGYMPMSAALLPLAR